MSRKQFIESQGATCRNWTWSWSFVNHDKKIVIFGAFDTHYSNNATRIMSTRWQYRNGKKQAAFQQSLEHIRLIEDEGYKLKTFPMINEKTDEAAPAKIKGFKRELFDCRLKKVGDSWYAASGEISISCPEEIEKPDQYFEGASKKISVNVYERNREARKVCLNHLGFECSVCGFDFYKTYGTIGEEYIHVHHVIPISEIGTEYRLDPLKDLVPICPNCHAMIHRTLPALSVEQLKQTIREK